MAVAIASMSSPLVGQTDYYNTDRGRPLTVEDAHPVERHAFELQVAPLRLERSRGGTYAWEVEPEIAYGILPRTQVEVGLPFRYLDGHRGADGGGLGGIEISALHNLNVETTTLPALAIAGDVSLPVGRYAANRAYPSLRGIATRTFTFARVHANAGFTFGATPGHDDEVGEASRWMAGAAMDRALPLRSLLPTAGVYVERPLRSTEPLAWTAEAGFRYQTSPQFNLDLGAGRRLNGEEQGWFFTFGLAHAFAVRSLIPGR